MSKNYIDVSVSTGKPTRVSVSTPVNQQNVDVTRDTSAYNAEISKQWATSETLVLNEDYSSKYYANKSKGYAQNAESFESATRETYNNFVTDANSYINELTETKEVVTEEISIAASDSLLDIRNAKEEAVENVTTVKSESIASVEAKGNEIVSVVNEGIAEINSTKTTIINDIEFVADGEKKEIEDLIDNGKEELKESIGDVKVLTTLEIGDIGFTQMAIDETKGKRRVLNGQLIIQEQYLQFTNIIKNSVALNPDLACTESEWQTAVTMSANGVCYKYVIDDEAGTIRLPKYPKYLDLSINGKKTVSVYGSGKSIGLSTGSNLFSICAITNNGVYLNYDAANKALGTSVSGTASTITKNNAAGITTDPNTSGLTGSVTTSSEQIKGTYFIQVATGAETEDNIINEIELNNPFSFGDSKYSQVELNNISFLKSEGQWNSKAVYPDYYNWILVNANAGVADFKLSTDTYDDYSWVVNTADETFRLPLLNGSEDLLSDKYIDLTLGASGTSYTAPANGVLELEKETHNNNEYISLYAAKTKLKSEIRGTGNSGLATFIPLLANETCTISYTATGNTRNFRFIYAQGNGSLYFYVGETVQNANLINAGRIEEQVASCLNRSNKQEIINWGLPDYTKGINITFTSTGFTYTAPANGFLSVQMLISANTLGELKINNVTVLRGNSGTKDAFGDFTGQVVVRKGDVITAVNAYAGTTAQYNWATFYPMKGAN